MSGGSTIRNSADPIDSLKLQSSAYGGVIPLVYGVGQITGNLLWYGGFKKVPHTTTQGGKGGGGAKQESTTFSYTADFLLGLAHGCIPSVTKVWKDKSYYEGGLTPSTLVTVTESWTATVGSPSYTVAQAAHFASFGRITRQYVAPDGTTVTVPLQLGKDYNVASGGIVKIVNPDIFGYTLATTYQYTNATPVQSALNALGMTLITGNIGQPVWSGLASYGTQAIAYSGLAMVAAKAYTLNSDASVANHKFEVIAPWAYHLSSTQPDVDPSIVMKDLLTNGRAGVNFPGQLLDAWSQWSDYCVANNLLVSPEIDAQISASEMVDRMMQLTNSETVWSGARLKVVPYGDTPASANGRTFTPDITPVYDLTDELWLSTNGAPLTYHNKSPSDCKNMVTLTYSDRSLQYADGVANASDLTDISVNGQRPMDAIDAKWIKVGSIARTAAQLIMQRSLYVQTTYSCSLPWHYSALEPMDLVTVTDAGLGLDHVPCRVKSITEDNDGNLVIDELEEVPSGIHHAALYDQQALVGFQHDYNVDPGLADDPLIFEVPAAKSITGLGIYVAVRGSITVPNTNWGGAQIWVSQDGTNYKLMDTVTGPSRYGYTTSAIAPTDSSFAIDSVNNQLLSGSAADAAALNTLCYLGGTSPEFFAYQTATLTGPGAYTLNPLVRAAYGTAAGSHAAGVRFVRVDDQVARSEDLDVTFIGKTLYFKILPFNIYGQHLYQLSDVSAYTYTVTGGLSQLLPGVGGKGLVVNASSLVFKYDPSGTPTPGTVTLTAIPKGILSGTVTWSVVAGSVTYSVSGNTLTIAAAGLTTAAATIRASITDSVGVYFGDTTITQIHDGAAGANGATGATGPAGANGSNGANAPLLSLAPTGITFTYDGNGSPSPGSQTLSFDAILQNTSGAVAFTCTLYDVSGSSLGGTTLGGSGNTGRTLTVAQFSVAAFAVVRATLGSLADQQTIIRLQNGASAPSANLSNDAQTLPADVNGHVTSYTGAVTTMHVYLGNADDSGNWSFSGSGSAGVAASQSGSTFTITALADANDSGYLDITATRSGYPSQTKRFTLSKSKSSVATVGVNSQLGSISVEGDSLNATTQAHAGVMFNTDGIVYATAGQGAITWATTGQRWWNGGTPTNLSSLIFSVRLITLGTKTGSGTPSYSANSTTNMTSARVCTVAVTGASMPGIVYAYSISDSSGNTLTSGNFFFDLESTN